VSHFLDARCWLDDDGRHVWVWHWCRTREIATMLPWPTWQAVGGRVEPSISCLDCDLHAMSVPLEEAPDAAR
jgi:hypothetical protein